MLPLPNNIFLFQNISGVSVMDDDSGICVWKRSFVNGGTSFNGGRIMPESDLNDCIACSGYNGCDFYVPYTHDVDLLRYNVRSMLRRVNHCDYNL